MAKYEVNEQAVEYAKRLIESRRYVLDSDWGAVQPHAEAQNKYLESHSWEEYGQWHLGLTVGASDETRRASPSGTAMCGGCTGPG